MAFATPRSRTPWSRSWLLQKFIRSGDNGFSGGRRSPRTSHRPARPQRVSGRTDRWDSTLVVRGPSRCGSECGNRMPLVTGSPEVSARAIILYGSWLACGRFGHHLHGTVGPHSRPSLPDLRRVLAAVVLLMTDALRPRRGRSLIPPVWDQWNALTCANSARHVPSSG